jgi:hypothetical protein
VTLLRPGRPGMRHGRLTSINRRAIPDATEPTLTPRHGPRIWLRLTPGLRQERFSERLVRSVTLALFVQDLLRADSRPAAR